MLPLTPTGLFNPTLPGGGRGGKAQSGGGAGGGPFRSGMLLLYSKVLLELWSFIRWISGRSDTKEPDVRFRGDVGRAKRELDAGDAFGKVRLVLGVLFVGIKGEGQVRLGVAMVGYVRVSCGEGLPVDCFVGGVCMGTCMLMGRDIFAFVFAFVGRGLETSLFISLVVLEVSVMVLSSDEICSAGRRGGRGRAAERSGTCHSTCSGCGEVGKGSGVEIPSP